jgi:peptidoglycan/xylan/chitin deacetylase (PgdA/CDA1 family)
MTRFRPLVLCYHAVSATWEHQLSSSPDAIARQLGLLLRWYRPVTAAEVLTEGRRGLHVTFDDGFRSVTNVLPTLRRLGVPATIFVCSDYADSGRALEVRELLDEVAAHPDELATLRWDEVRALAEDGVEIGSHTASHPRLTQLDDAELHRELSESRERITDELGRPCRFLAYPYGDEDRRVRAAARQAGYEAAFALPGPTVPMDAFGIPRLGIWRKDHLLRMVARIGFARGGPGAERDAPT